MLYATRLRASRTTARAARDLTDNAKARQCNLMLSGDLTTRSYSLSTTTQLRSFAVPGSPQLHPDPFFRSQREARHRHNSLSRDSKCLESRRNRRKQ